MYSLGLYLILIDDENILWVMHMQVDSMKKLMVIYMPHHAVFHSKSCPEGLERRLKLQVIQERMNKWIYSNKMHI